MGVAHFFLLCAPGCTMDTFRILLCTQRAKGKQIWVINVTCILSVVV